MKGEMALTHEFVEYIPDVLQDGTIYVSIVFATVVHKCCCGCGNEVVTPLSPTDWKLTFDGESVSLEPSIGNWSFACQSHYWIKSNRVKWAQRWTQEEINSGRAYDTVAKKRYSDNVKSTNISDVTDSIRKLGEDKLKVSLWQKLKRWLF